MGLSKEDWTLPLPPMMNKYSLVLVGGIYFKWRRERREIGLYTVEHFSAYRTFCYHDLQDVNS